MSDNVFTLPEGTDGLPTQIMVHRKDGSSQSLDSALRDLDAARGDLTIARLRLDARVCSECPARAQLAERTADVERIQTLHNGLMADAEKRYEEVFAKLIAMGQEVERLIGEVRFRDKAVRERDATIARLREDADRQVFPAGRDVGRVGDMAPPEKTHMRIVLDCDNDVCVEIWDAERGSGSRAGIEFCTLFGGGKSPKTRAALIAVMVAMDADNIDCPRGQFPPARRETSTAALDRMAEDARELGLDYEPKGPPA